MKLYESLSKNLKENDEKTFIKKVKDCNGTFFDIYKKDGRYVDGNNQPLDKDDLERFGLLEDSEDHDTTLTCQKCGYKDDTSAFNMEQGWTNGSDNYIFYVCPKCGAYINAQLDENSMSDTSTDSINEATTIDEVSEEDNFRADFEKYLLDNNIEITQVTDEVINDYFTGFRWEIETVDDVDKLNRAEDLIRKEYLPKTEMNESMNTDLTSIYSYIANAVADLENDVDKKVCLTTVISYCKDIAESHNIDLGE